MENVILYVKSKKISTGGGSSFTVLHGYVTDTSSGSSRMITSYEPEDQEAISLLERSGMTYKLVDLTESSFATRLKAKLDGIKTPTMILNDKKIVGAENIRQALKEMKT